MHKIKRALLSVSDKSGLIEFARALHGHGVELISTGGTAKALKQAKLPVRDVSEITGFPEMMDGRLKTLHPKIHGGLLALRDNAAHREAQAAHEIADIDLLVVTLYPFEETVAAGGDFSACIENIDIGGPAMIRAAAKNHGFVAVVVDPVDYELVLEDLAAQGGVCDGVRASLAAKAFGRTASYDAAIANWFAGQIDETTPLFRTIGGRLQQGLRYGENPHQEAGFYVDGSRRHGVASATQVQGKELSYNNINDTDAAFELVAEFDPADSAAVAIIKHANPCGVALGAGQLEAYQQALKCDPQSAFGGIVALNRRLETETAQALCALFTEVIIAPGASEEAQKILASKKNLRLLLTGGLPDPTAPGLCVRSVAGGFLAQSRDIDRAGPEKIHIVTQRAPSHQEMADMVFAMRVAKHVKSNAIVYAKDGATVGIGAGQMSRIDSVRIAANKAADAAAEAAGEAAGEATGEAAGEATPLTQGSVVASDAFFPFADGLLSAAQAGATAIIQPGGSRRDEEVIRAADEQGLAMVFTGIRHFRH